MMVAAPAGQLLVSAVALLDQGRGIDRLSRLLTAAALIALIGIAVWGVLPLYEQLEVIRRRHTRASMRRSKPWPSRRTALGT